jgi:hypothetical protein
MLFYWPLVTGEFSLDHVARKLGLAPHIVRELNFYQQVPIHHGTPHIVLCVCVCGGACAVKRRAAHRRGVPIELGFRAR